jgi:hypothetical protein
MLSSFNRFDRDSVVLFEGEFLEEDDDEFSNSLRILQFGTENSDERIEDSTDRLVRGKVSTQVYRSCRSSFRFVSVLHVEFAEHSEGDVREGRIRERGGVDDVRERSKSRKVYEGMRIRREGKEDVDDRFEDGSSGERSDVRVNLAEREGAASSIVRIRVADDLLNAKLNLRGHERSSS